MADDSDDQQGLILYTQGKKFSWYGDGASTITADASFNLTYGVKSTITLGLINEFSVGAKTEVSVGTKLSAGLSANLDFSKGYTFKETKGDSTHTLTHQVMSVGGGTHDEIVNLRLKIAAGVLITLQMALMVAATATAIAMDKTKIAKTADEANADVPDEVETSTLELEASLPGYIVSVIAGTMNALTVVGMIVQVLLRKFYDQQRNLTPTAVLSLDSVPAAFLGIQPSAGGSLGLSMDNAGLQLSASANNLVPTKVPGADTIAGYRDQPDANLHVGARLRLDRTGTLETWSASQTSRTRQSTTQYSPNHTFEVTDGQGQATDNRVTINAAGTNIQPLQDTWIKAETQANGGVDAKKGRSFMRLSNPTATIGHGGNTLSASQDSVELKFGATTLTLDANGISIGNAVTILTPAGGMLTGPDLNAIEQSMADLQVAHEKLQRDLAAETTKRLAAQDAAQLQLEALLQVRVAQNNADEAAASPAQQ